MADLIHPSDRKVLVRYPIFMRNINWKWHMNPSRESAADSSHGNAEFVVAIFP